MEAWQARNADERTWRVVDAVRDVAQDSGVTASQVALAWLGAQPAVTSVILGVRSVEQLIDNMDAADLELGSDARARLDEASAPRIDDYPYGAPGREQRHRSLTGGR
jgi:aryl-alcohol dehydrogenase (NADP+)